MTKEQILAALPKLKRDELEAVHAVTGSLLGGRLANTAQPATPLAGVTYEALSGALNSAMPYASMPSATARQFQAKVEPLKRFLDSHFTGWNKNKIGQLAFLKMLFGLMVEDLKQRGVNPTIGIMIVNMIRMPELFENAFPGYLSSGLGSVILKNFQPDV